MDTNNQYKILAVEDDEFLSKVYEIKLQKEGFDVTVAKDSDEANQALQTQRPDLILLDLVLPKKNGFEILKEIKANPEYKDIPVIILSNLGQESDIEKGKHLGAAEYIVKVDFTIQDIILRMKKLLSARPQPAAPAEAVAEPEEAAPESTAEEKPGDVYKL